MSTEKPVLYSGWKSSCSWRVRIALALKEIEYEIIPASFYKSGDKEKLEEYKKVNPMGQIPALIIDGYTLIESVAIMHYLDETRPERPLLPQDPYKRAKVRAIVEVICSGIQPLQNTCVVMDVDEEKRGDWITHWVTRGLMALEKLLTASSGKYCVGDEISMADVCLVPQVFNAEKKFHLDMTPYPSIVRINKELLTHAAFRVSHPMNQTDYDVKNTLKA